jgi:hypothetical protein
MSSMDIPEFVAAAAVLMRGGDKGNEGKKAS